MKLFRFRFFSMLSAVICLAVLILLILFPERGRAADLSYKAPSIASAVFNGYPYGSSGLIFGLYSEGGGGSVNATIPGLPSASLSTTSAGFGGTIGYSWGQKGSNVAYSIEGDFGMTNFNGNTPGLSMAGPLSFEQRFVAFTPLAALLSFLPNFPALGTVAPFPTLPTGVTGSNVQLGLMLGIRESDISANWTGLGSNREWRIAPVIGLVAMEQLSNNTALREYVKTVFPDKGACLGPIVGACANLGQQILAGVGVYF